MTDKYKNAVKLENGDLENFILKVAGKPFHCDCGCNVFHKPDKNKLEIYRCNACDTTFESS